MRKRMAEQELKDWEDVNRTLRLMRDAEIEVEKIEGDMNKCINDIKEDAEKRAQPYKDLIKKWELQLKEFVTLNKAELRGKSRALTFGSVGFRLSTKLKLPKDEGPVIKLLRKMAMGDCINVKESVNKEILKTYDEKTIALVGGTLSTSDTFWYETNRETLQEQE